MGFLDPKERVLDIILTQQGKKLLSQGKLIIKYYSFTDTEVDYEVLSGYTSRSAAVVSASLNLIDYTLGTFSRESEASYFYEDTGTLQRWPSGSLRKTTVAAPNGLNYYVFEGARTNTLVQSEALSASNWTKELDLLGGTEIAPDGELDAFIINPDGAAADRIYQGMSTGNWYGSAFVRASGGADLSFRTGSTSVSQINFSPISSSWQRVAYQLTGASFFLACPHTGTNDATGAGVPGNSIYFWGAQIEANATFPSTYIRTTTAAGTRVADSLSFATNVLGNNDFCFYVRPQMSSAQVIAAAATFYMFGWASDGAGANAGIQFRTAAGQCRLAVIAPNGGILAAIDQAVTFAANQVLKVTVKPSSGQLVLEGFTTGNGTIGNGTPWTWPNAAVHIGKHSSTSTSNLFGLMTEPFSP